MARREKLRTAAEQIALLRAEAAMSRETKPKRKPKKVDIEQIAAGFPEGLSQQEVMRTTRGILVRAGGKYILGREQIDADALQVVAVYDDIHGYNRPFDTRYILA